MKVFVDHMVRRRGDFCCHVVRKEGSVVLVRGNWVDGRSQWPRGLRRRSAAAWLLGSRVRIPLGRGCGSFVFICCMVLCR
jgi:hypothetical protein